jgi:dTDP-4-dehydrorhamnose 3,5-epimerase-like enzyme
MDYPRIIDLPKFLDSRGNLSFFEQNNQIPFKIERTYWIYDVPGGECRGGHAFKENQEFIVSLSGAFDVVLKNGKEQINFTLNRSYYGLYIPNGWWREMLNFSTNSVALIVGSTKYSTDDYIRDYDEYLFFKSNEKK